MSDPIGKDPPRDDVIFSMWRGENADVHRGCPGCGGILRAHLEFAHSGLMTTTVSHDPPGPCYWFSNLDPEKLLSEIDLFLSPAGVPVV